MSDRRPAHPFPGEIRQVGHIVSDIDVAMAEWLVLGVGPWTVIDVSQTDGRYRGTIAPATTTIGFANAGSMQIELIEATGEASSVWHEARDLGRFGPHHVAYWVDDFDTVVADATAAGMTVVQEGDGNSIARFAYFELTSGMLIEVMEHTDLVRAFMDGIRESCETWDGTGPAVRR